jgi:hypothetical protein
LSSTARIAALEVLHNRVVEQQAAFSPKYPAGMLDATIAEILTHAQALDAAEVAQEAHKLERISLTRQRIETHTTMWKFAMRVSDAAAIVFDEQPEIRMQFDLPPWRKTKTTEEDS